MARGASSFDVPLLSRITPTLWTGCSPSEFLDGPDYLVRSDGKPRFDAILNLFPWGEYEAPQGTIKVDVEMYDGEDISENLEHIVGIVTKWLAGGLIVLVHCQAGLNRSALVAARSLMVHEDVTAREAIKMIRESRSPMCLCNEAFEKHLLSL